MQMLPWLKNTHRKEIIEINSYENEPRFLMLMGSTKTAHFRILGEIMKKPFKDDSNTYKGEEKINPSIWNNKIMPYDERSSCYANVGVHYGVGKAQPVGHTGPAKASVDCLPLKSMTIMDYRNKKTITVQE